MTPSSRQIADSLAAHLHAASVDTLLSIAEPLILDVVQWLRNSRGTGIEPTNDDVLAFAKGRLQTLIAEGEQALKDFPADALNRKSALSVEEMEAMQAARQAEADARARARSSEQTLPHVSKDDQNLGQTAADPVSDPGQGVSESANDGEGGEGNKPEPADSDKKKRK